MSKRTRQYIGLMSAILAYYIIHEGAHLIYALITGTFKQINIMGLGMQIDIHAERMTDIQLGVFCLVGSVATFVTAYVLVLCANKIGENSSKIFKACMYYITIAMLLIDPIYLSVLWRRRYERYFTALSRIGNSNCVWNHFGNQCSGICENCFT